MLDAGVPREKLFFTSKVPPKEINYEVPYSPIGFTDSILTLSDRVPKDV